MGAQGRPRLHHLDAVLRRVRSAAHRRRHQHRRRDPDPRLPRRGRHALHRLRRHRQPLLHRHARGGRHRRLDERRRAARRPVAAARRHAHSRRRESRRGSPAQPAEVRLPSLAMARDRAPLRRRWAMLGALQLLALVGALHGAAADGRAGLDADLARRGHAPARLGAGGDPRGWHADDRGLLPVAGRAQSPAAAVGGAGRLSRRQRLLRAEVVLGSADAPVAHDRAADLHDDLPAGVAAHAGRAHRAARRDLDGLADLAQADAHRRAELLRRRVDDRRQPDSPRSARARREPHRAPQLRRQRRDPAGGREPGRRLPARLPVGAAGRARRARPTGRSGSARPASRCRAGRASAASIAP